MKTYLVSTLLRCESAEQAERVIIEGAVLLETVEVVSVTIQREYER